MEIDKRITAEGATTVPAGRIFQGPVKADPSARWLQPAALQRKLGDRFALLSLLIIAAGLALRTIQYLSGRALRRDEASLALNLLERSYAELLLPLSYSQVAPRGFLWAERLLLSLFGNTEYVLRLLPFLAGCASLFLFWAVARRFLSPPAVLVALALFATSPMLIFFASDLKPYSLDVAVALLLFLLALEILQRGASIKRSLVLGLVGAMAVWLSYPSVFVMAGLAVGLSLQPLLERQWHTLRNLAVAYALWAASAVGFLLLGLIMMRRYGVREAATGFGSLQDAFQDSFMPLPRTLDDLRWFPRTVREVFSDPLGFSYYWWFALLVFLAGCAWALRHRRDVLLCLLIPIFAALGASGLRIYPFEGRLLLFLVPSFLLLIAAGAVEASRWLPRGGVWLAGLLAAALVLPSSYIAATRFPHSLQEIRPAMQYLMAQRAPGDALYIHWVADRAFPYYANRFGISPAEYELGAAWTKPTPEFLNDEFARYRAGGRTWIFFSHAWTRDRHDERRDFLEYLDDIGTRLDWFEAADGSVYLYELR